MQRNSVSRAVYSILIGAIVLAALAGLSMAYIDNKKNDNNSKYYDTRIIEKTNTVEVDKYADYDKVEDDGSYKVTEVIDGDTIKVQYGSDIKSVRLIGVNAPETVDSDTGEQCYGKEASDFLKRKLINKEVALGRDSTQGDTDKYGRLLRYVVYDGKDVGAELIGSGYAKEYTYDADYVRKDSYLSAQDSAKNNKIGLWGDKCTVNESTQSANTSVSDLSDDCVIKGNISRYGGSKIYHVPGQKYYDSTVIIETEGERWFCSEAEAQAAGWRKSKE